MLLLVLVAIVGVAIGVATQGLTKGPEIRDQEAALSAEVLSELEQYRAMSFATLAALANKSDTVQVKTDGTARTFARKITIQKLDPTNPSTNASPQSDFLQVQITVGDRTALLWVTQP